MSKKQSRGDWAAGYDAIEIVRVSSPEHITNVLLKARENIIWLQDQLNNLERRANDVLKGSSPVRLKKLYEACATIEADRVI